MEAYGFNSQSHASDWAKAFEKRHKRSLEVAGERLRLLVKKMPYKSSFGFWAVFRLMPMQAKRDYMPATSPRPATPDRPRRRRTPKPSNIRRNQRVTIAPPVRQPKPVPQPQSKCPPNCSWREACNHPYFTSQDICPADLEDIGISRDQILKDMRRHTGKGS